MPKFSWKKKKTIAMYLNRRQGLDSPLSSLEVEIEMEHIAGSYLVTEASSPSLSTYIITE